MAKTIGLWGIPLLLLLATGCGATEETVSTTEDTTSGSETVTETTETEETENEATESDVYFKDGEAKLIDLKIQITETKVIPPGEPGNEYGDKAVLAIWYDTTNLTGKDIDPTGAWMIVFEAIQDNDPNAVNTLEVGMLPDEQFLDSQLETIKQDGTVSNAVAYELDDLETPVTLVATQGIAGDKLGEQTIEIK
ncbi:DUF5067 domain-containing protein [Exiguobacterium sp. s22]|uniref:DUF5067 domain-containing protein n=1 Tax=Exiguobacterium sp. s22 TaxID=2751272 RepID=UPI001BE96E89|nr:DUF5067 domain-containing protein [Exiguobacterium sp. s22]